MKECEEELQATITEENLKSDDTSRYSEHSVTVKLRSHERIFIRECHLFQGLVRC